MEPISFLLDSFIQLAERIINLEKTKREDKQKVFKEVIEPLFVQLQPIAENYIQIFRETRRRLIENPNIDLHLALAEIRQTQEKMALARSTVKTMAKQVYLMYNDLTINAFASAVLGFFDISIYGDTVRGTRTSTLIELFEKVLADQIRKQALFEHIVASLLLLEKDWDRIGQSYAAAKIYCLSAPQLVKKPK
jgi:hypothetical protein